MPSMSATPDLDALAARVADALQQTCLADFNGKATPLLRDLLTYATTVRQERDEARKVSARQHELLFSFHAATDPERHAAICERIGNEADWCEARVNALEAQVASLTAQLAEARKDRDAARP
jgi:hypothetical protein